MEFKDVLTEIGRDDVSVTFGLSNPIEIVGPLKPKSVYYGKVFGYDKSAGQVHMGRAWPMIMFSFNKYRSDLPPWESVREMVLASMNNGHSIEASFIETNVRSIDTTGDLKTVEIVAEGPSEGVDCAIIEKDEVA